MSRSTPTGPERNWKDRERDSLPNRGKNDSRFLLQVRQKLPLLYLIDSIVKNVGEEYKQLFQQEIVAMFVDVFDKVRLTVCWP